ncbi:MAG: DUF1648 domain-containing protein [Polyangiales bacterium]
MRGVRTPLIIALVIVAALAVRIADVWDVLPATMGSHFGPSGAADAFMSKGAFFLTMACVGGGSVALVFAAPLLIARLPPRLVNLPNRDYWLENEARRQVAVDKLGAQLGWLGASTTALLALAVELAVRANLERAAFANGPFMVALVLYLVLTIAFVVWTFRAFEIPASS